jgi:hypothetical protein
LAEIEKEELRQTYYWAIKEEALLFLIASENSRPREDLLNFQNKIEEEVNLFHLWTS